ncbi:SHOCT domain-containing protein [Rhizobacter sp. LjRoot28]|jgi:hypothetical protein|uniref:SHOCT domain-containing protein n=1 Tax=Rhizobacter sp. LjRoot28 TaxID=3342309 RepID=UPI003ED05848
MLKTPFRYTRGTAALALAMALSFPAAAQKPLEFLFGGMPPKEAKGEKLVFRINELSAIQLVPRETGSTPNQHPARVAPDVLRQQLAGLRVVTEKGNVEPLFGESEAQDIAEPLANALAAAGPEQDLLLLSSSRRDGAFLTPPVGLTARLFVAGERLNVLVQDARVDYYGRWRGTHIRPEFTFGSRQSAGKARLQAQGGTLQRSDWAVLPLVAVATPAPASTAMPAVTAAPAAQPMAPTPAVDAESRLRTLKRLRDTGLITEDEYQQKRGEILKSL